MNIQIIRRLLIISLLLLTVLALSCSAAEEIIDLDLSACNRGITYAQMM